jgi:hypothetical protein
MRPRASTALRIRRAPPGLARGVEPPHELVRVRGPEALTSVYLGVEPQQFAQRTVANSAPSKCSADSLTDTWQSSPLADSLSVRRAGVGRRRMAARPVRRGCAAGVRRASARSAPPVCCGARSASLDPGRAVSLARADARDTGWWVPPRRIGDIPAGTRTGLVRLSQGDGSAATRCRGRITGALAAAVGWRRPSRNGGAQADAEPPAPRLESSARRVCSR